MQWNMGLPVSLVPFNEYVCCFRYVIIMRHGGLASHVGYENKSANWN